MARGKFLRHADAAKKSAFFLADGNDVGAIASNQVPALLAHPVGHEDRYRMTQHGADSRKGHPGITARGFRDDIARMDLSSSYAFQMCRAMRSLMLPVMFNCSDLAYIERVVPR